MIMRRPARICQDAAAVLSCLFSGTLAEAVINQHLVFIVPCQPRFTEHMIIAEWEPMIYDAIVQVPLDAVGKDPSDKRIGDDQLDHLI